MGLSQVSSVLEAITVAIQVAVIVLLLRGPYRRYPLVLVYCVLQLAATITEEYVYRVFGDASPIFSRLYWTDEVILDLLLFLMVISLIYRALESSPMRAGMGRLLGAVVVVVLIVPFVLFSARRFSSCVNGSMRERLSSRSFRTSSPISALRVEFRFAR